MSDDRFELIISPTARRQLTDTLPESVALAAYEFIIGPLLDNPGHVGKRLRPPLDDRHSARRGTYRVIYRKDTERHRVTVVAIVHRADAYRTRVRASVRTCAFGCAVSLAVYMRAGVRRAHRDAAPGKADQVAVGDLAEDP